MSWISTGLAVGGAVLGNMNAKAKQKQEQKNQQANAVGIENSPWTGMNPGLMASQAPSALGGTLQGGLSGAMMGQQFGKGAGTQATTTPSAAEAPMTSDQMTQGAMDVGSADATKPTLYGGGSPWEEMQKKKMMASGMGGGTSYS